MKILFVIPRIKSLFGDKGLTVHPHIGIAYLCAFLKSKGIIVKVFDEGIVNKVDDIQGEINEFRPDIIGLTIFSYCYDEAYKVIKKIRQSAKIPLVLGGCHVSAVNGKILEDTGAEFAIKNEGEHALLELLEALDTTWPDFSKIDGLIWRECDKIIENKNRPYINNLDELPFADYEAFNITHYACYKQKTLPLITSRGCPFGCNYCSVRLSMGQLFRARSAKNVVEEIRHLYDKGWRNFDINDDCFTLDKKRANEICDLIINSNIKIGFQLYNGIRVDTVDLELLRKMKHAGCYFISYGCESGSEKVLKAIKKGITLSQVVDAINWTNEVGINNSVNFIVGHKGETYKDALDTLDFAGTLPTNFVNFYNLLPYPGTESYEWARQQAKFLVPRDQFLKDISYRDNNPIYETNEFTKREREKVISMGFNLYRKKIFTFRLGQALGGIIYWITCYNRLNKLATNFALNNPLGRFIYTRLSRKSFIVRKEA